MKVSKWLSLVAVAFVTLSLSLVAEQVMGKSRGMKGVTGQPERGQAQHAINDPDGDGLCNVCGQPIGGGLQNSNGKKARKGQHWGPGDGSANQRIGPKDGTGYEAGSGKKLGPHDGSGAGSKRGHQGGQAHRGGRQP